MEAISAIAVFVTVIAVFTLQCTWLRTVCAANLEVGNRESGNGK